MDSKTHILSISKTLFWKHGLDKVSVEDICKEGGFSKLTFYIHFKNKNEVASQLISKQIEYSLQKYRDIMQADTSFRDKVSKLIKFKYELTIEMSEEYVKDIYHYREGGLRIMIDDHRQKMYEEIKQDFTEAQKKGWIRKELNMSFLMNMLQDIGDKIFEPKFLEIYKDDKILIEELTDFFCNGILQKS